MTIQQIVESSSTLNFWGHVMALLSWLGSLLGLLPVMAALVGFIFYSIKIYESDTCQKKLEKIRTKRKGRRIAKLYAEQKVLLAELEALETVREARVYAEAKVAAAAHEATVLKAQYQQHEKISVLEENAGKGEFKSTPAP